MPPKVLAREKSPRGSLSPRPPGRRTGPSAAAWPVDILFVVSCLCYVLWYAMFFNDLRKHNNNNNNNNSMLVLNKQENDYVCFSVASGRLSAAAYRCVISFVFSLLFVLAIVCFCYVIDICLCCVFNLTIVLCCYIYPYVCFCYFLSLYLLSEASENSRACSLQIMLCYVFFSDLRKYNNILRSTKKTTFVSAYNTYYIV